MGSQSEYAVISLECASPNLTGPGLIPIPALQQHMCLTARTATPRDMRQLGISHSSPSALVVLELLSTVVLALLDVVSRDDIEDLLDDDPNKRC